jgi:hypothetical protein
MSKLQQILTAAKQGREPWEPIPPGEWPAIAARCGAPEVAEIRERIAALEAELPTVDDWDGDTRDDIHRAMELFRGILALAKGFTAPGW